MALVVGTVVALSINYRGVATADVELNDGGVWVSNQSSVLVGRLNYPVREIDATFAGDTPDIDLLQRGDDVVMADASSGLLRRIDTATVRYNGASVAIPGSAQIALGDDAIAVLDPADGRLWVTSLSGMSSIQDETVKPTATLGEGAHMAMGDDGTVAVVDVVDGEVLTYLPEVWTAVAATNAANGGEDGDEGDEGAAAQEPSTEEQPQPQVWVFPEGTDLTTAEVQITMVGDQVAILAYEPEDEILTLLQPDRDPIDLSALDVDLASARLQTSSVGGDAAAITTSDAVVVAPLNGDQPRAIPSEVGGPPVQPVQVNGCIHSAWAGDVPTYVQVCGDDEPEPQQVPEANAGADLTFRVNRNHVVLNDLRSGDVWMLESRLYLVQNWEQDVAQTTQEEEQDDPSEEETDEVPLDRDAENQDPTAEPDEYGVRPGRVIVLPVLDNDSDPDGDLLTVATFAQVPESFGIVEPILGGRALQVRVTPDASGEVQFDYAISDGRQGTDESMVTLTVHPNSQNAAPLQTDDIKAEVVLGESVEVNVLNDVIDPDGDEIFLVDAVFDDTINVDVSPDGLATIRDLGVSTGLKEVTINVSDGRSAPTPVTINLQVLPTGAAPPQAVFDFATGFAGEEIEIEPLANDLDPNGKPLDLANVLATGGGQFETDNDANTFTFTSQTAGSFYLTYVVTDDDGLSAEGLVRVDVRKPASEAPPVAVRDTALLPTSGAVVVDVLDNDFDPAGGVLAVQSIEVPPGLGLQVAIIDHRILRISSQRTLSSPVTITYTVSNGSRSSLGEVTVIPLSGQANVLRPIANADTATVRIGDYVTIPVTRNDVHPNGIEFHVTALTGEPAEGLAFISQDLVRFAAPDKPGTYTVMYEITDVNGQRDAAEVTIYVEARGDDANAPPKPKDAEVRAFAGERIRIPIDLYGIDPDGDSVSLVGPVTSPTLGRIVEVGSGYIDYLAYNGDAGTDSFDVSVRDRIGAVGTATVTVGVIAPPDRNRDPVTLADVIEVRPDRDIQTDVVLNDTDPDGDQLQFASEAITDAGGLDIAVEEGMLAFRSPSDEGTYTVIYQVDDTHGGRDTGSLTVVVDQNAKQLPPIAVDDVVPATDLIDATSVTVDVLDNDYDPDGSAADLVVGLADGQDEVTVLDDGRLRIPVTTTRQVVTYQIADADENLTYAFVEVPGTEDTGPVLLPGAELEVDSGEELAIDLNEWVVSLTGRPVQLYDTSAVTASNSDGSEYVVNETTLRFVSAAGYAGDASITFSVTDAPDINADGILVSVLTIPITVNATTDQPPQFRNGSLNLEAGGEAESLDLGRLTADLDTEISDITFTLGDVPEGFEASLDNGVVLTASAARDTPKGTVVSLPVEIDDGSSDVVQGTITLTATGSTAEVIVANPDDLGEIFQGQASSIDALANDTNPFPGGDRTIVNAEIATGSGTVTFQGEEVTVTPSGDYVGPIVVTYTVEDDTQDPDRWQEGTITGTVLGAPEAPARPAITLEGSEQVVIDIAPPLDNGSPITAYLVSANGVSVARCPSTSCTVTGLTNGTPYTFTVVAVNAVGESPASPPSAEATPDKAPPPVAPPSVEFGDGELSLAWVDPGGVGTAINQYDIQISPVPANGASQQHVDGSTLSYTWSGLENGTVYKFRIRGHNEHPDAGAWGGWSRNEYPSGPPLQPAQPSMTRRDSPAGGRVDAAWAAPDDNGDSIDVYHVTLYRNGSAITTVKAPGGATTQLFEVENGYDYSVTVVAENRSGPSAASPQSAQVTSFGAPGQVTGVSGAPTGNSGEAAITYETPSNNGQAINRFEYRLSGGGSGNLGPSPAPLGGLTNGTSYTIQVRACNTYCGAWSPASAPFSVYGKPAQPGGNQISSSKGAGENGKTVSFAWNYPATSNGATIVAARIYVDGGGAQNRDRTGSISINNGAWDQNHTFQIEVQNEYGQWSPMSAVQNQQAGSDPTPPSVTMLQGRDAQGQPGCTHASCAFLDFTYENLPNANYTIRFYASGESGVWRSYSANLSGTDRYNSTTYRGRPGETIRVVISGGGNTYEDSITWPSS